MIIWGYISCLCFFPSTLYFSVSIFSVSKMYFCFEQQIGRSDPDPIPLHIYHRIEKGIIS